MKPIPFIIPLTAVLASASTVLVKYDTVYDNPNTSMDAVACSDGKNGMETKGYPTFGSLPTFPNIGGAYTIAGYNSTSCGSCWKLTYNKTATAYITAIDHADNGFVISKQALAALGGQQAVDGGQIYTSATAVKGSYCGLQS
jgi:hypothetical protein